ncbi:hypothetical protein CEE37_12590 [candidate division LCP-89 bacterium B3_LCP]|uniref:Uncharacterized protein n=1 Tax=candidate division LCP-89 bacterium B3_LCP TaxID=2012998 RepID=A0A532UTW3_UNCL8|nr:MAG: hypothetical protein CEE37_12590 [candidate division LCP-89 bacterium B3_LCP]
MVSSKFKMQIFRLEKSDYNQYTKKIGKSQEGRILWGNLKLSFSEAKRLGNLTAGQCQILDKPE